MKAAFNGGPWAGSVIDLPVAFEAMDVEHGQQYVRYRLARWDGGMPHYEVDGMPRLKDTGDQVFPMPGCFATALDNDGNAISSRAEADAAIAGVAAWLHQQSVNHPGGDDEPQVADVAREFSNQLLESAKAEGNGGCPLCGS